MFNEYDVVLAAKKILLAALNARYQDASATSEFHTGEQYLLRALQWVESPLYRKQDREYKASHRGSFWEK